MNENANPAASPAAALIGTPFGAPVRAATVGFAIAALLAACAGPLPTSGSGAGEAPSEATQQQSGTTGSVLETGEDVSAAGTGPRDVAVFASPSGVICDIAAGYTDELPGPAVECFVPHPAYEGWEMTDQGIIEVDCPVGLKLDLVVDSQYWLGCEDATALTGPTLAPGTLTRAGGFLCTVQADTIDCTYGDDYLGFRIGNQSFSSRVN